MICPSLPQENYEAFSKEMCKALRPEKCEHVWAGFVLLRSLLNRPVTVPDRHFNRYPCRILYD